MLAVISDLHLQHTADDGIRYRDEGGAVQCLTMDRNVSVRALRRFFSMLHERARRCDAARVHLILAGDVFEIHRSPRWFDPAGGLVRPYTRPNGADGEREALRQKVEAILGDVVRENDEFLRELREFAASGVYRFCGAPGGEDADLRFERRDGSAIPVEVHFIPGNHDRLVNVWPRTRQAVRRCLGMGDSTEPFPHWLDAGLDSEDDAYLARVRHGHEYDAANFPAPVVKDTCPTHEPDEYQAPCFGDYAIVDILTRLALAFRVHNAARLRQADGGKCRELYMKLTEFDDVRPLSELGKYLLAGKDAGGADEARWLLPALRDVCAAARSSPFVEQEVARLALGWGLADSAISALDSVLGTAPAWGLYPLIRAVTWLVSGHALAAPAAGFAARESGLGDGVRLVVAAHTHCPEVVPLPSEAGRECFFLDSGTWRTVVPHGAGCFGHLRAYTMVFVYSERESAYIGHDDRRFETWTGYLVPDRAAAHPLETETPRRKRAPQHVTFTKLDVERMPEDGILSARGAELDLQFGVDGTACEPFRRRVRAGRSYVLKGRAADLDPELDGEVWCHAVEEDIAVDDVLPWAMHRLARTRGGSFSRRAGTLVMEDATTRIVLHYSVT